MSTRLVVCYDIVEDARRARLNKRLAGLLRAVQKSVFEGQLPAADYPGLLAAIHDVINHATDTVRVYHLCGRCVGLTELFGTSPRVPTEPEDVVI